MAKKLYHIPLQKTQLFIKEYKSILKKTLEDKKLLELYKLLGKAYYTIELDNFIHFFKINKDSIYALSTIEYFNSIKFIDNMTAVLNFTQFDLGQNNINKKDFFYAFCYTFHQNNEKLFKHFLEKMFLHYHTTFTKTSNIQIDFKDMSHVLAKSKKLKLKESFGEDEKSSYFKILIDNKIIINERGKLIKTLRKKAYKAIFFHLIDLEDKQQDTDVYEQLHELKIL